MDPLSVSASIVALLSATAIVVKGIDKLRALRHAPIELIDLFNEVSDLQASLTHIHDSVEGLRALGSQLPQDALHGLPHFLQRAGKSINDLQNFVSNDLRKNVQSSGPDFPKASRRAWLGKDNKLAAFRSSIREVRGNLALVLNSTSLRIFPHILLNIQEVVLVDRDHTTRSTEALEEILEKLSTPHASIQGPLSIEDGANSTTGSLPSSSWSPRSSPGNRTQLRVKTSLNMNRCDLYCNCQCHVRSNVTTPRWLRGLVGTLFYSYTGTPMLNSQGCNSPRCRRSTPSSSQFCYYFPTWIVQRALIFTSTWKDMTGAGASWSIRVPRVIANNHMVWAMIEIGNLPKLQRILATREVSPFDVREDGSTLLKIAEYTWRLEIVAYLIDIGADLHLKNNHGICAADGVWTKILNLPKEKSSSQFRQLLGDDEDYNLQLSPIHRIVLGLSNASLFKQLELDVAHINSRDWQNQTPLMWAALRGNTEQVKALVGHGSDIHLSDSQGRTALHLATTAGSYECVEILLESGADTCRCDIFGQTPLHYVARSISTEVKDIINLLSTYGADLEARNKIGLTPLYRAAFENRANAISALIACGADVDGMDNNGFPALANSIQLGKIDATETLCKEGASLNWDETHPAFNVLGQAALFGSIAVMHVLAVATPKERIIYDPEIMYYWFDHFRDREYVGPEEDADELLAALENLLDSIGTPAPHTGDLDEEYDCEDEDVDVFDSEEDASSDDESTVENFEDAVEVQELVGSMTECAISESTSSQEYGVGEVGEVSS